MVSGADEIAPNGSNFQTRKTAVSRGAKSPAFSPSPCASQKKKKLKIPRPPGYRYGRNRRLWFNAGGGKTNARHSDCCSQPRFAYGKAEWACERVTKNRGAGWNRREIPVGHARRFILRESYRRNVRKFEIVTSHSRIRVCAVNESTLILDQETLD